MGSVSVIIPAFNEAQRLPDVLQAVRAATLVDEIIVVDDGSTDNSAEIARTCGAHRVLRSPRNRGKGSALHAGALAASGDLLVFLDADLHGLTASHVDQLIAPVYHDEAEMTVGIFNSGRAPTDFAQHLAPNLSGQRCLRRAFFLSVPYLDRSRSGVEIAMTTYAHTLKLRQATVVLDGVTHRMKEEKLGVVRGVYSRWRMYTDIVKVMARYRLSGRRVRRLRRNKGKSS